MFSIEVRKTKTSTGERPKKSYHLTWPSQPLAKPIYNSLVKWVYAHDDYGPMTPGKIAILSNFMKKEKHFNSLVIPDKTLQIILSARNIILKGKIIKNHHRMNQLINAIAHAYNNGRPILELAKKYDFPPLNLLRGIFLLSYGKDNVYKLSVGKISPQELLAPRDLEQYILADAHDAETTINQQLIVQRAEANEKKFVDFFTEAGIKLKTQNDLFVEQENDLVKLTPDILFEDEVFVNDKKVSWIDYKDYACTPIPFLFKKNIEQAQKYFDRWGDGALCYRLSFVEGLEIPHAQLLDGSMIGVNYEK